jgi:hypothetical protein
MRHIQEPSKVRNISLCTTTERTSGTCITCLTCRHVTWLEISEIYCSILSYTMLIFIIFHGDGRLSLWQVIFISLRLKLVHIHTLSLYLPSPRLSCTCEVKIPFSHLPVECNADENYCKVSDVCYNGGEYWSKDWNMALLKFLIQNT